ncbi:MAG TPA: S9 family peptidase [Vicinamibacterales bacterium]|jgi:dipeptidyl aminopeptidase/acylaminoacyl peptidase
MMRRTLLALLVSLILIPSTTPKAASKRAITETDLLKFTWIADPQISPDGANVAFVKVVVNEKENRYETSLYTVPTSGGDTRRLTSGIRDTGPCWSSDGKSIAFVRSIEKDGKSQPGQVYLLRMDGGEARPLTDLARGASGPEWSPDGKRIAFISPTGQDRREGQEGQDKDHKSDVKVITRAVYRANGNPGYVDGEHHAHVFVVRVPEEPADKPVPEQITDGEFDERGLAWAPDGTKVYFTSTRVAEAYYDPQHSELYSVPAAGGSITKVAAIAGTINDESISPDGKRIAFLGTLNGNPVRSYSQPDLFVTDAAPGATPKNLTAEYDFDVLGGIGGDQAAPRGNNPKPIVWSADGSSLIISSAERGSSNLKRVNIATGKMEPVTEGAQDVVGYTASRDGATIAVTLSTQTNIGDISVIDVAHRAPRAITHVNDELFKDIQQSEPEEITYTSFDGKKIQGWIMKPTDFDASKKYPMILEIHGGPHSAYGNVYTHEFQWMAAKGYVVLFTNPRGSTSYGQEFGNIIQYRYPGDDYKDLMAGVDEVVKRGYVDANRLGVTGGSGGGLLTDWTITQTQRFKAAVAQRDIADWSGFWYTADFTLFQPTWFRKAPWEDPQDYAARSPITHVANVTTPLMLVLGDADYRTPPPDGGEQMFRALKYRKIPTVMVRFPRETHELSRSGEPFHRIERLRHIVGWMDQWLAGKKNAAYATQ